MGKQYARQDRNVDFDTLCETINRVQITKEPATVSISLDVQTVQHILRDACLPFINDDNVYTIFPDPNPIEIEDEDIFDEEYEDELPDLEVAINKPLKRQSKLGEPYITLKWSGEKKAYAVAVQHKYVGSYKTLPEAIVARDKYIEEHPLKAAKKRR